MQCVANQWYKGQTGKALCYSLLIQWPYFSALMGYSSCFDPARMQLGFNPVRDVINMATCLGAYVHRCFPAPAQPSEEDWDDWVVLYTSEELVKVCWSQICTHAGTMCYPIACCLLLLYLEVYS